ncbi:ComEC family competence protein [Candidatus Parcubacteria bacterium]|nr:MAG: ComEC family competence protein [Candidatus Parcubacteria bacterium]
MRPENVLFLSACGFVGGVISGGLGVPPLFAFFASLLVIPALIRRLRFAVIMGMAAVFIAGNLYYALDDYAYRSALRAVEHVTGFEGRLVDEPRRSLEAQTAKVDIRSADVPEAAGSRVYVRTELHPELSYGDIVRVSGEIIPPPSDSYGNYMAKEHVHGTAFYPEIEVLGNEANPLFKVLFGVRNHLQTILARLFNSQQAAFLSGILLGDKDGFSPEFLEKLSVSGTMHLMALSGLNMTIIVFAALGVFSLIFWKRKRPQFIATFSLVALFVAMTGFQVSAVRAALMAFLVGFADMTHRLYSPHNAIAFAALVITAWNPKAPVFDLGFQLSFLATLAIIYLTPVIKRLPFLKKDGVLGWRDVLAITLAAQLGVAPLTIINFGNFSLTALLANIGILAVIPLLTVAGFLVAFAYMLFPPLALLLSKPIAFLIDYVVLIVETFAVVYLPFNPNIGFVAATLYYAVLIWICWRYSPALTAHEKRPN